MHQLLIKSAGAAALMLGLGVAPAHAAVITQWTFETSLPATAGPFAAEFGTGSASGFHAGATTYSTPAGNGSAHSYSSNTWAIGDYYQFTASTLGFSGISLSWDQVGSATGPRDFKLAYSTNGTTFSDFASYSLSSAITSWSTTVVNAGSALSQNLASITALSNQATVYFRLIDNSTVSINGGTVAAAGTGRVDNFTINGTAMSAVPLPPAMLLLGAGLSAFGVVGRRRKAA
jgi:hypothetical protein